MWMRDIALERDAGMIHCASVNLWGVPSLAQVLMMLGLPEKPEALEEVSGEKARAILEAVLAHDMAYKSEAMPRNRAAQLASEFIESQLPETRFFVNADWTVYFYDAKSKGFSWTNLTDATFDAGVVAISDRFASCIWAEDED